MADIKNINSILVAGLGKTGLSVIRFLKKKNLPIIVADSRENPPNLQALKDEFPDLKIHCGEFDPKLFCTVKQIVLSPGIPLANSVVSEAQKAGVETVGDIELFARELDKNPQKSAPVIAITGSNGKSTVTTLVGEMAKQAGWDVKVGGNLGQPALDLLTDETTNPPGLYVLELSSFQLETTYSLKPAATVILNVSADHLNRYNGDLELYAQAKDQIYQNAAVAVWNREDTRAAKFAQRGKIQTSFGLGNPPYPSFTKGGNLHEETERNSLSQTPISNAEKTFSWGIVQKQQENWIAKTTETETDAVFPVAQVKLPGQHNLSNALAALALGSAVGIPEAMMLETLKTFRGLPHRTELVAEKNGVRWVNDSKGTNVGAAAAAIEGLGASGKIVWIAGGQGKGADFSPLKPLAEKYLRNAVLIGEDAGKIVDALQNCVPVTQVENLQQAAKMANRQAQIGDWVLLSPACASFDQFSGFEERGRVFTEAVQQLLEEDR